jgi:hypothetical protein
MRDARVAVSVSSSLASLKRATNAARLSRLERAMPPLPS